MGITTDQLNRLPPEIQELILLEEELRRERGRKFFKMFPLEGPLRRELYEKHILFFSLGAELRQRTFMAANRVGKTMAGLYEVVCHMTGRYPEWWTGKRFKDPVRVWLAGDTGKSVRESLQAKLLGAWGEFGTGMLPEIDLLRWTPKQGVAESVDTFTVRHGPSGGVSRGEFKSYDQGRESFQYTEREVILLDEEPPEDIYGECVIRTMTVGGVVMLTFTPLQGVTNVVKQFLTNNVPVEGRVNESRALVIASWNDVPHLNDNDKKELLKEIPEHLRDARTKGIPVLGSGMVFQFELEEMLVDPFDIPPFWPQGGGFDFGWDHPNAATKMAWNRDTDTIYVTADWRKKHTTPLQVAEALKPWGTDWLPFAWPHDGMQHDKGSGEQLAQQYRDNNLLFLPEKATFPDGTNGVEAGIMQMADRMRTGRWKVFKTCNYWKEEYRTYHRENGIIVKEADDVICASRYSYMMRRYWTKEPAGRKKVRQAKGWV